MYVEVDFRAHRARAQHCAHTAGLLDNSVVADDLLAKKTFASFLLECMRKCVDPHLRNFFEAAIDPNGDPVFSGKDFGCVYFKPRENDPTVCGLLVHSLSDTQVPIGDGGQMKLPFNTAIADNWSDYHAHIIILGSKHFCFKMFAGTTLNLKKLGQRDFAEAAAEVLRKTKATKLLHTAELDSSLQPAAKRRRPVNPPKAAGVIAASVPAPSSPPQGAAPNLPKAKASAASAAPAKAPGPKSSPGASSAAGVGH